MVAYGASRSTRHTFRSPAYPDWAQRRSALSASLSECLISHSVHDHRWSHLSLPLAVPLDAHVLPLPRQRISSMTLLSNTTTDIIGQAPFLSSHYPSPTSHYPHQFPSIPPLTRLLRFRHTIYGFSLQTRPGTASHFSKLNLPLLPNVNKFDSLRLFPKNQHVALFCIPVA